MPSLSSIPVLTGKDRTNLTAVSDGLLLRGRHVEINIPGRAVARVRAEGASVAVELRAPAGAVPVVYRIEGVDAVRAVAFADGVNSLLEPAGADGEEVDGASLVVSDTRTTPRTRRALRRAKRLMLATVAATVVGTVAAGVAGGAAHAVVVVIFLPMVCVCLVGFAHDLTDWAGIRRIRKHGVREFARPSNAPGTYLYPDGTGLHHALVKLSGGPYLEVVYDPEDPADVVSLRPGPMERLSHAVGLFLLFCAALFGLLMAIMLSEA
ncbi:hypothetical protein AB0G79_07695 [Streptomyces sp. NPDC020807]|uniref:hypothetical protein n=1 Tax=Streptomyces sp. NPDC020807 TaxID=3155119 RepID=UPI0033FC14E3